MEERITKVLEIKADYGKAIENIAKYEREITKVKQEQEDWRKRLKELNQQMEDDSENTEAYADAIKEVTEQMTKNRVIINQLKNEQAAITKHLQQQVKAENAESESLVQLRARLSQLTQEYDEMSGEMRNGEAGQALMDQINEVTNTIKGAEEDTQRYYRNVGNYANSVREAFAAMNKDLEAMEAKLKDVEKQEGANSKAANELRQSIEQQKAAIDATNRATTQFYSTIIPFGDKILPLLGVGLKGTKQAFKLAAEGAKMLSKQFLALMMNPIVAFLALTAAAIAALVKGIRGSEENMNRWQKIMAPVTRALAGLQSVIEYLCGWILSFVEFAGKMLGVIMKIGEALPIVGGAFEAVNDAVEESIELSKKEIQLEQDKRKLIVRNAKDELEIAKLKKEATDKGNKDYEARIAAAKKANDMELALAEERKRLSKEEYEIAKARAEWAGNSAKDNEELANLEAAMYRADMEYYNKSRELQNQINEMQTQQANEKKKANEEAIKTTKERADKEYEAVKEYEDNLLKLIKDSTERQVAEINQSYDREIAALQKKLDTEKNLTTKARQAIIDTITAKEVQREEALNALDEQILSDRIASEQKKVQLRLDAVKKGTEEEYNLKVQQNDLQMQADIAAAEKDIENTTELEETKSLIRAKYAEQERELTAQRSEELRKKELEEIQRGFEERLLLAADNATKQLEIELEQKQAEIDALQQMEGESIEAFNLRKLQMQTAYNQKKKAIIDAEVKMEQDKAKAIATIMGSIGDAIESLAGDNKKAAAIAKVVGLAELYINQAVAISEAVRNSTAGDPYTMAARIAAAVASVLAGTVSAFASINKAHFAKGGKVGEEGYATGGKVYGAGTGTSDSIPAMLSNGEFVMTAATTRLFEPLLRAMNAIGSGYSPALSAGQVNLSQSTADMIGGSVYDSVSGLNPVVSVVDINEGQRRVSVIDTLDYI